MKNKIKISKLFLPEIRQTRNIPEQTLLQNV